VQLLHIIQCAWAHVALSKRRRRRRIVRRSVAQAIKSFLITDDNFARNRTTARFSTGDRAAAKGGLPIRSRSRSIPSHKIKQFIENAGRAGVNRVSSGSRASIRSTQGSAQGTEQHYEYARFAQAWHSSARLPTAGNILVFQNDTREHRRDIEIIKREIPLDVLDSSS